MARVRGLEVMEHLLTVASWEFSPGSERLWTPSEDRGEQERDGFPPAVDPTGPMPGDVGSIQVFECRSRPGRPSAFSFDRS
ncbi:hypothetical protein [Nocardiopsis lambiniae]|uniref:Uncharacterized protein n=1 Tax=Nocardiopsis lambiniae TaxID=3075539 RepID=A0ABU2MC48_9ACTN|nr:hypothetical protein [Nocardiopsis sp. DSM 44743]MDT0330148.1 hypothetical protein [Nocardiopsis sp. DSM 44743]